MNRKTILPFSRLLLPVKDFELFCTTLPLVELFSRVMTTDIEKLDLLHVIGGSFLSTHLNNIDFRAGQILSSDLIPRLRTQHYDEFVRPLLAKVQQVLAKHGAELQAGVRVEDGDPATKIRLICEKENFSTLIMARRKKDEEGFFSETVLDDVINHYLDASVYIIGEKGFPGNTNPVARVMVGIDGSSTALGAAREAAILLTRAGKDVEKVCLVNVRDPSCFFGDTEKSCKEVSAAGYLHLKEAEAVLIKEGVDESKIKTMLLFGRPGETLTEYAKSFGATICFIGRRDRSKISEVLLGSNSRDLVRRCRRTTVALVS